MIKPTLYPTWADDDIINTIYNTPNKSEPDATHKSLGYDLQEMPDRQYMNYQFNLINQWLKYLSSDRLKTYVGQTDPSNLVTIITLGDFSHNNNIIAVVRLNVNLQPSNDDVWFYLPNSHIYPNSGLEPFWFIPYNAVDTLTIVISDITMRSRPFEILVFSHV
jgi:hypothetical protein